MVMARGLTHVLVVDGRANDMAEIEIGGMAQAVAEAFLESLPLELFRHSAAVVQ
jgi:hypothetical protein